MIEPSPDKFELLSQITHCYNLKLFKAINYCNAWQLQTNDGYKYLKKTDLAIVDLCFTYEALEFLNHRGFKTAPRFQLNHLEMPFLWLEGDYYFMTNWYPARELDFQLEHDLRDASRYLAKFHRYGAGFEPSIPQLRTCWSNWPAKLVNRLHQLEDFRKQAITMKETSAFSRLYLRHFEPHYRQAITSYQQLLISPYPAVAAVDIQRKTLCYNHYFQSHLLRASNQQLLLVNFEYCLRDLRLHDLIKLIVPIAPYTNWDMERCRLILREYHHISKLSPAEIQVMYLLLTWPDDFWRIGLQYYQKPLPWSERGLQKQLEAYLADRFNRAVFLEKFPQSNGVFHWREATLQPAYE